MDELRAMLRDMLENQRIQRREIDEISRSVAAIAKALEQEDRLQERLERAEAREREELSGAVADLKTRVENHGVYMRDLPERLLSTVERKIYELRTARWETGQLLPREVTPPFGTPLPPGYRDQTGKIAVANPDDDMSLTPSQQRGLVKAVKTAWQYGRWPALAAAVSGSIAGLWQHIVALFKH